MARTKKRFKFSVIVKVESDEPVTRKEIRRWVQSAVDLRVGVDALSGIVRADVGIASEVP